VAWLARRGRRTIYTPDTSVAATPSPLLMPHLRDTLRHAAARGVAARETRGSSASMATALSMAPLACAALGVFLLASGAAARQAGSSLVVLYVATIAASSALAAIRYRSLSVGAAMAPALVATQLVYVGGFVRGLARGR
jgi:hypothetical protein